jgi:hypothetical protein
MEALQLTNASVTAALAHAQNGADAAAAATAVAVTSMDGRVVTAAEQEEEQVDAEDGLMRVLQQLAATQAELLQQGPPFESDQMGELADQLAQVCSVYSSLLRRVCAYHILQINCRHNMTVGIVQVLGKSSLHAAHAKLLSLSIIPHTSR